MKLLHIAGAVLALAVSAQAGAHGRLAQVSVYDRAEHRQLPVYWHEGKAWVVGKPGNEYQVQLRSRREELLAVVSVDGVNVVTGETAAAAQSGYLLYPGHAMDIRGWRKNMERIAAFYFTDLPDSYAARTGRPDNVGVIGAALFRKKLPEPVARPHAAPPAPLARQGAGADAQAERRAEESASSGDLANRARAPEAKLGTGHGRDENSQARWVEFERASTQPAEVITIYYDSYRNLVARGVIRGPAAPAPLPRPFPGFVPDPA